MADRAVGLAPAAHPELDEPPARATATTARIPTASWARTTSSISSRATPAASAPRSRTHVDGHRRSRRATTASTWCTDQGTWSCDAVVVATGASSEPHVPALAAELPATIAQLTGAELPQPGAARRRRRAGGRCLGLGRADRRRAAPQRSRRGDRRRRARSPARDATAAGTSTGGWTRSASSTSATTRSTTSTGRVALPSLQLVGSPDHRTLDLNALVAVGVGVVGKLMRVDGGRAQFSGGLGHLLANADLKQAAAARSARRVRRRASASPSDLPPPTGPAPTSVRQRADRARPRSLRHGRLGDGLPADVPVARPGGVRPARPGRARRRRGRHPRPVLPRPAVHAPAQVELHRRGRPGRRRAGRAPARPPRPPGRTPDGERPRQASIGRPSSALRTRPTSVAERQRRARRRAPRRCAPRRAVRSPRHASANARSRNVDITGGPPIVVCASIAPSTCAASSG